MPEVRAPRAADSADRTTVRPRPDNSNRTAGSLSFRDLLCRPAAGRLPAHGPVVPPNRFGGTESSSPAPPDPPQAGPRRDPDARSEPDARPAAEALLDPLVCQLAVN